MAETYPGGLGGYKKLEQSGPLPIEDLARYMLETCEALAEAHAAKIVHRDLKPSNLFLAQQPDKQAIIKVLDFGISKLEDKPTAGLTKTSALMGTAFYMSPEQLTTPKAVDHRSDIWALGVIMYELLTAKQPFEGESVPEIIASILQNQREPLNALRPGVPEGLVAAIDRCLMFKVGERFANVAELAAAIAPFASIDDRRSVAIIGRVLGERVAIPNAMAPQSAVVRPAASTSLPSAVGATQHSPSDAGPPGPKEAPVQTSTAAVVAGAVTTHGLSTSVAGVPRPTKRPIAIAAGAAVLVVGLVGVGLAMRSGGGEPAPASGMVSAPSEAVPAATSEPAPKLAEPALAAPLPSLAPEPEEPAPAATTAKPGSIVKKPAAAVTTKATSTAPVKPVASATATTVVATTTAPPPTTAPATSAAKNPLQMGIK